MPPPRKLDDDVLRVEVLAACRELIAEGRYPSQHALQRKGVVARYDRMLAARDALFESGDLSMPFKLRRTASTVHRMRMPRPDPRKPPDDPADAEGPCWRERRAFWGTEAGKRTRQLLLRSACQSCT